MAQRLKQRLELLENSSAAKEKITVVRIIVDPESKSLTLTSASSEVTLRCSQRDTNTHLKDFVDGTVSITSLIENNRPITSHINLIIYICHLSQFTTSFLCVLCV